MRRCIVSALRRSTLLPRGGHGSSGSSTSLSNGLSMALNGSIPSLIQCRYVRGAASESDDLMSQMGGAFSGNDPRAAFGIYKQWVMKEGKPPPQHVYRMLVIQLAMGSYPNGEGQDFEKAEEVVKDMLRFGLVPNVAIYEAIIMGCLDTGNFDKVNVYYRDMLNKGVQPNTAVYNALLSGLLMSGASNAEVQKLHDDMKKLGVRPDKNTQMLMDSKEGKYPNEVKSDLRQIREQGARDKKILRDGRRMMENLPPGTNMQDPEVFKQFSHTFLQHEKASQQREHEMKDELERLKAETKEMREQLQQLLQKEKK